MQRDRTRRATTAARMAGVLVLALGALANGADDPVGTPFPRAFRLERPRPRVVWTEGEVVTVRWRSFFRDPERVRIEASSDRGATWSTLGHAPVGAGEFSWIPAHAPQELRVRLRTQDGLVRSNAIRVRIGPRIVEIAMAEFFALALLSDGTLRTWGEYPYFQTADGRFENLTIDGLPIVASPRRVSGFGDVRSVAAGGAHALVITREGRVLYWGATATEVHQDPVPVEGIENALFARAHYDTNFVRLEDGRVLAWGANIGGSLGDGTSTRRPEPTEISALAGALDIRLGNSCGLALMPDGTVLSWGFNGYGQAGDGTFESSSTPRSVLLPQAASAISIGTDTAAALLVDGTVMSWGGNDFGELGRDRPPRDPTPTLERGLANIRQIACSGGRLFAIRRDGALFARGPNDSGGLGVGKPSNFLAEHPVRVDIGPVAQIFVGYAVHVISERGHRYGWGYNNSRLVGDGGWRDVRSPKRLFVPWDPAPEPLEADASR